MKHFYAIGNKASFTEWVVNDVKKGLIGKPLYFDSMMQCQPLAHGLKSKETPPNKPYTQESQVRKWLCREYPMFITAPEFPLKGIERYYKNPVDVWIDRYNSLVEEENMTDYGAKEQIKGEVEIQRRSVLMEKTLLSEQFYKMGPNLVNPLEKMSKHFNKSSEKKHMEEMYRLQRQQQFRELQTKAHSAVGLNHPLVEEDRANYIEYKESYNDEDSIQMDEGMITGDEDYKKLRKEQAEAKSLEPENTSLYPPEITERWESDGERVVVTDERVFEREENEEDMRLRIHEKDGQLYGVGGVKARKGNGLLQPLDLPPGLTREQLDNFLDTYPELKRAFGFPIEKGVTDPFVLQALSLGNSPNPSEWPRDIQDDFNMNVTNAESVEEAEEALTSIMDRVCKEATAFPERFQQAPSKFSTGPEETKYLANYLANRKHEEAAANVRHLTDRPSTSLSPFGSSQMEERERRVLAGEESGEEAPQKLGFFSGTKEELAKAEQEGGFEDEEWEKVSEVDDAEDEDEEEFGDAEDWFDADNRYQE